MICFDEFADRFDQQTVECLGPSRDKRIQAQRVFDALRAFDSKDVQQIYAQCPDSQGLGLAIGNRLKKAAGFKTVAADQKKVVIGITGGTGSGKTSALNAIRDLGGVVIDCDAVYHEMLNQDAELRHAIEVKFHGVFNSDGSLNRKKLGELVFENKERMAQLNEVIYQFLVPEVQRRARDGNLTAIDAINLIESGVGELCDRTGAVTAPAELRVRRIMARDGIDERYARMRISAQKSDEFYRSKCDYELSNTADTPEAFRETARVFFERLIGELREEKDKAAQETAEAAAGRVSSGALPADPLCHWISLVGRGKCMGRGCSGDPDGWNSPMEAPAKDNTHQTDCGCYFRRYPCGKRRRCVRRDLRLGGRRPAGYPQRAADIRSGRASASAQSRGGPGTVQTPAMTHSGHWRGQGFRQSRYGFGSMPENAGGQRSLPY